MKVWKVTEGDGKGAPLYIASLEVLGEINILNLEEVGNQYLVEVVEMEPDKFYTLPEWSGF